MLFAPCTPHPKECAQIAINQMVHISSNMRYETTEGLFTHFKYWSLVKEEIEKL